MYSPRWVNKRITDIYLTALAISMLSPLCVAGTLGNLTYQINGGTEVEITDCASNASGALVVPDTIEGLPVKKIGNSAFYFCKQLTSVELPESVNTLGSSSFGFCTALTSVTLPSGLTTIPDSTFSYCTSLSSVAIPAGVTTIGSSAFYNTAVTSVNLPTGLLSIGYNAFYNCDVLTSISIPASLSSVGNGAFGYCNLLATVVFQPGCSSVPIMMFNSCPALASVTLPDGMLTIGYGAFQMCTGLTSISIPSSVTAIDDTSFSQCSSLLSINVNASNPTYASVDGVLFSKNLTRILHYPTGRSGAYVIPSGVTQIGMFCFEYCTGLSAITIPSGVTAIGSWGFRDCTNLTSVDIPSTVTSLGYWCFFGCDRLNSITVPASVSSIGPGCFADCQQLANILVEVGNSHFMSQSGVLFNVSGSTLITCPAGKSGTYLVPATVTTIGDSAFWGCDSITAISMHNGITTIGDRAFYDCDALGSLEFPPNATITGAYTCAFSSSLAQVKLPTGMTRIPASMFTWCSSLSSISLPGGVQVIEESAFYECASLSSVVLPAGINELQNDCFYNCDGLAKVYFLGNAPIMGSSSYEAGKIFYRWSYLPQVMIYYLSGRTGFTSPTWHGYNTTMINEATYPAAGWLLNNGLDYNSNLNQDPNGDGVKLLMEYALNLKPSTNNAGNMPVIQINGPTLEMKFPGLSQGILYKVYRSTNLSQWVVQGVTLSGPDGNGIITASIPLDSPQAFMKLEVSQQ